MSKFHNIHKLQRLPILLLSLSDLATPSEEEKIYDNQTIGDFHFKRHLEEGLRKLGAVVNDPERPPKVVIFLHGRFPSKLNLPDVKKILWIHSHPEDITPENIKQFDKIFSLSPSFTKKLTDLGSNAETLIGFTNFKDQGYQHRPENGLVFVGNNRTEGQDIQRPIVADCLKLNRDDLQVTGLRWDNSLPKKYLKSKSIHNDKLGEYYANSKVVLNDHHKDMLDEGFLNPRILDAMAAGALVVSDSLEGAEEIFDGALLTYDGSSENLAEVLTKCDDERFRRKMIRKGQRAGKNYTLEKTAIKFIEQVLKYDPSSIKSPTPMSINENKSINIVLGMHRSGTSLLAGLLHNSGIFMGEENYFLPKPGPENPKGFFENYLFRKINDTILEENSYLVKSWQTSCPELLTLPEGMRKVMLDLINYNLSKFDHWGWKDPRQMLTTRLWFELLEDYNLLEKTHILFEFRNPFSVAASMLKRKNIKTLEEGLELWLLYNNRALEAIKDFNIPTTFISMENLSNAPENTLTQINKGIAKPITMQTYQSFFSRQHIHNNDSANKQNLTGSCSQVYNELLNMEMKQMGQPLTT